MKQIPIQKASAHGLMGATERLRQQAFELRDAQ